jgi:hypothetical protein
MRPSAVATVLPKDNTGPSARTTPVLFVSDRRKFTFKFERGKANPAGSIDCTVHAMAESVCLE